MLEENVPQDTNPEEEQQPNAENESEETNEDLDKAKEYGENQKVRAEKAEKKLKALEAKKETETPKKEEAKEKSNEPDYAKLAFLEGKKVVNADDQKLVLDEAERLKLPLTDILNMQHIKTQLKDAHDQREAKSGSPKGKGKAGSTGQHDVDHHLAKGTTPEDVEEAKKVIDARMKSDKSSGHYDDQPIFSG